jgi:nicotinamidase/pyrazinamidase
MQESTSGVRARRPLERPGGCRSDRRATHDPGTRRGWRSPHPLELHGYACSVAAYDDRTALMVMDVQNDFADPAGGLYVRGGAEVVPVVNAETDRALAAGAFVAYTQDWHPPDTPHFAKDGGLWPVHCVAGTWGAEFHPQLRVRGAVIRKGTGPEDGYSGFSVRDPRTGEVTPTQLAATLPDGVHRLVITGLATDYCVLETVLDGRRLGYAVDVIASAIRAVDLQPGDGDRAIERMLGAGATVE